MAKFLIDMPKVKGMPYSCTKAHAFGEIGDCPFCVIAENDLVCGIAQRIVSYKYEDKRPDWCPLIAIDDDDISYSVSYEGNRTDMWYEVGSNFDTREEAMRYIEAMRADDDRWHAFQITEWVEEVKVKAEMLPD